LFVIPTHINLPRNSRSLPSNRDVPRTVPFFFLYYQKKSSFGKNI
jgi:hypothetical protein